MVQLRCLALSARNPLATDNITPAIWLWVLRMLVPLVGHRLLLRPRCFTDDDLTRMLGMEAWIDPEDRDFDPAAVHDVLRDEHRDAERSARHADARLPNASTCRCCCVARPN